MPEHQWKPLMGSDGKGLKAYKPEAHPDTFVTGGAYTIQSFQPKGKVVFRPNPNYYGTPSNADAVVLQFYTNADAMIGDLENGTLQWVDKLPFEAVNDVKQQSNLHINVVPGSQTTNITWNSNPYKTKNRELLDPKSQAGAVRVRRPQEDDRRRVLWVCNDRREHRRAHLRHGEPRLSGRRSTTATRPTRRWTSSATRAARTASGWCPRPPARTPSRRTR